MKDFFKNKYTVAICFLAVTFLVYFRALDIGYLSDDFGFLVQAKFEGWNAFSHNFNDPFFIPLSHFIALIFYYLFDGNADAFHALQLVVHGLIAWQLYKLLLQLNVTNTLALLTGFLFIFLPYQSESVVWLSAKSYGYSLLFSLLSLRYFFTWYFDKKRMYLRVHFLFLIAAILSKEMAFVVPFVVLTLLFAQSKNAFFPKFQMQLLKSYALQVTLVFLGLVLLRWFALGSFVGGYGDSVHFPSLSVIGIHFLAWIFKFVTLFRYTQQVDIYWVLTGIWMLTLSVGVWSAWINKQINFLGMSTLLILLFWTLLPVLSLEITSVKSIASERYGYFASTVVAFGVAYLLVQLVWIFRIIGSVVMLAIALFFIHLDLQKWQQSSDLAQNYLQELAKLPVQDKEVLLINVPDNFQGAYCLRNGIEAYLQIQNISAAFTVSVYQTCDTDSGGVVFENNQLIEKGGFYTYYSVYPNSRFTLDLWEDSLKNDFDTTLLYYTHQFKGL